MQSINFLYKYYSRDRIDDLFKSWTIRFTPLYEFNDPFEGLIAFNDVMNEKIYNAIPTIKYAGYSLEQINSQLVSEKEKAELSENLRRSALSRFGVFCLTTNCTNLLMWSHYAEGHTGFVVKFNINSPFFNKYNERMWKPHKVKYTKHRPLFKDINNIDDKSLITFLTTKSDVWEYEHEYRMFCSYVDPISECFHNNQTLKVKGIHSISQDAIVEVICGARMSYNDINKINKLLNLNKGSDHISIKYMALDRKRYQLKECKKYIPTSTL